MARNAGKEIDAFVKTFLLAQKAWRDNDMADARRKYYEALTAKTKGEGAGGLSDSEFRSRMGMGGGPSDGVPGGPGRLPSTEVYQAAREAGFSDNQARALVAEAGRENGLQSSLIFGMHRDPHNGATNFGVISMQGARGAALKQHLTDKGLVDDKGRPVASREALAEQFRFIRNEMSNDPAYSRTKKEFLENPNVDPEKASEVLGRNYIRWRYDDPKYASHHATRRNYLAQVNKDVDSGQATTEQSYKSGAVEANNAQPVEGAVPLPPRRPDNLPATLKGEAATAEVPSATAPGSSDPETGTITRQPEAPEPAIPAAPSIEPAIPAAPSIDGPPSMINDPKALKLKTSALDTEPSTDVAALNTDVTSYEAPPYETAALDFDTPDFNFDFFAADGGMMPEQEQAPEMPDAPLDEALGAALRGVQNMYGLGRQAGALPGSDPQREQSLAAMVRNEGAASPEQMKQLLATVDPDGRMPRGLANAEVLQKLYAFHAKQGDTQGAERATAEVLQAMRQRSMNLGALAGAALQAGDMQGAGKALIEAYNQVPDGRDVTGQIDDRGVGKALVRDARTGKVVQELPINPQILKSAVERLTSGTDFYPHLASMARPSRPSGPAPGGGMPAPRYAGGGAVDDEYDVNASGSYDSDTWDSEDAEAARMASAVNQPAPTGYSEGNQSEPSDEGDGEEVTAALPPVGARLPAPPAQPQFIDTSGMNDQQRRVADAVNKQRMDLYRQELQNYRQGVTAYNTDQRANARQAATDQRASARQTAADRRANARQAAADRRADNRQRASDTSAERRTQAQIEADYRRDLLKIKGEERKDARTRRDKEEDRQRERYNGMTEAEMRGEARGARVAAIESTADEAMREKPRTQVAMPEGLGGAAPAIPTMTMPEGVNEPRDMEDVVSGMRGEFGREFALQPGDQARMIRTREAGQQHMDETALDIGARASKGDVDKDRLEELKTFVDSKENGLFTTVKDGKVVYYGDDVPRPERLKIHNWAAKIMGFNGDLLPEMAGRSVLEMVEVKTDKDGNPITAPNFSVKIDPKTGAGRVVMKDGLTAFNIDRETLRQLVTYRQAGIEKKLREKADADGKQAEKDALSTARAEKGFNELVRRGKEQEARVKLREPGLNTLPPEAMKSVRDPRLRFRNTLKGLLHERNVLGIGN